jgi:hypothetical protein
MAFCFTAPIDAMAESVSGCGKAGMVRDYATAVHRDVLCEFHPCAFAALLCFVHYRSQLAVFGI